MCEIAPLDLNYKIKSQTWLQLLCLENRLQYYSIGWCGIIYMKMFEH